MKDENLISVFLVLMLNIINVNVQVVKVDDDEL